MLQFQKVAIKKKFCLRSHPQIGIHFLVAIASTTLNIDNGVAGVQFVVGPCGGHARKDGRTGFSRAAPATLQCLRWPYWVLKRSACRASTFKMAVLCSQVLHLPHFNLYDAARSSQALHLPRFNFEDGRTGFSSAAPAALQPLRWPYGVSSAAPVTQTKWNL